jgi:hypothetical protein
MHGTRTTDRHFTGGTRERRRPGWIEGKQLIRNLLYDNFNQKTADPGDTIREGQ